MQVVSIQFGMFIWKQVKTDKSILNWNISFYRELSIRPQQKLVDYHISWMSQTDVN